MTRLTTPFLRERLIHYKVSRSFERSNTPIRDGAGSVCRTLMRRQAIESQSSVRAS